MSESTDLTLSHKEVVRLFGSSEDEGGRSADMRLVRQDAQRDPKRTALLLKEEKLKAQFLLEYAKTGTIGGALKKTKLKRVQIELWRKEDEIFAQTMDDYDEDLTDTLVEVAVKRAKKKSDTLLLRLLEARRPEVFKPSGGTNVNITTNKWIVGENMIEF